MTSDKSGHSRLDALREAAREAWFFTLPLTEMAMTRSREAANGSRLNTLSHVRNLATHAHRMVTMPNNDTLYSSAQLDLSQGPITLIMPPSGDRYLSVALMDMYTNNFAILGSRTTGPEGGTFRLVGPADAASGEGVIRCPTDGVWLLARILVDGAEDLDAARAVQSGLSLQGPEGPTVIRPAHRAAPWAQYLGSVDAIMAANPPPVTDLALLRRIAPLGIGAGEFRPERFTDEEGAAIQQGLDLARSTLFKVGGAAANSAVDGWIYPAGSLGNFGQAYGYRAVVALVGLAALPPEEAMYMRAVGPNGPLFDGARSWRLHLPADRQIPVDGFWSLSLYEPTPEGQFFFTENPLGRYLIGDRSPGLVYGEDGSLDIWIGHDSPGEALESNWLPAPAGPFALTLRAYLPRAELLVGQYRLPPLTQVDG
jgi:hypothetical protein